ncbi:hypothetical protein D0Y65_053422 [Glycine soja]|uniref:Uncharacterized protein n=1 Tax=Glycine soja TaxID=3848 RepID=A0A445F213_GLYSO|nr:hypothetical protein D0Y65_053422 [Glycine soja]
MSSGNVNGLSLTPYFHLLFNLSPLVLENPKFSSLLSFSFSFSVRASITIEIPTKPVKIQRHMCSLLTRLTWILHRRKLSCFSFEHGIYILLIRCSALFNCKTLVVLKLIGGLNKNPFLFDFSSIDLPLLTTLHLQSFILERRDTTELPGGSLNLKFLCMSHLYFSGPEARFERFPKLVRATIAIGHVLLEVVNNVKFLHIDWMKDKEEADLILEFQNLTHLELGNYDYTRDWVEGLEVIKRCPSLQILDIDMGSIDMNARGDEGGDWPFPRSVPSCISLHLKISKEETHNNERWC